MRGWRSFSRATMRRRTRGRAASAIPMRSATSACGGPPGGWRPPVFSAPPRGGGAGFPLFGGRAYAGVNNSRLTEWERKRLAGTRQTLTVILDGTVTVEAAYHYDGRAGWFWVPLDMPVRGVKAVEIERDGNLMFSAFVAEDAAARDYTPIVWHLNARGKLTGAARGAAQEVPVEIRIDGRRDWVLTSPAAEAGKPSTFEFDTARHCGEGRIAVVAIFNPATGVQAQRSPLGVFACGEN